MKHQHHDGSPLMRGRKFGASDLQLMFLALLAVKPAHGYELIKDIELRSHGYYIPSPGVVYPALSYLEDTGLVAVEAHGNRKLYRVSPDGMSHLERERQQSEHLLAGLAFMGKKMDVMRRAMSGEEGDAGGSGWLPEYAHAQRALKHMLISKAEADASEQRRIAAILLKALSEIEHKEQHHA
jgi:DNA-binding PadR family transcriptional regulator